MLTAVETSVIISSRNRPRFLAECVSSILAGDDLPSELVIIDQSDTENGAIASTIAPASCSIRYSWSPTSGISRGRNAGIRLAQSEVLAFTDDDVLVSAGWLRALTRALLAAGPSTAVTGRVVAGKPERASGFAPSTKDDLEAVEYDRLEQADVLFSNNMAMHRSVFDRVGGFDERLGPGTRFPAAEDNDLGFRLLQAGCRVRYVPEATVIHRAWRGRADYLRLRWGYARGQGGFYAKHLQQHNHEVARRLAGDVGASARRVLSLAHGRRTAAAEAVSVLGLLSGAAEWLLTQRPEPSVAM